MKSIETIYQEMATVFSEETGLALDGTGEPSVRLWALAAQVYGLYEECAWTLAQCFPQTAAGEALDRHAALRGLARRDAARAEGTLTFSVRQAAERALTIPAGTVCLTAGSVAFETVEDAVLAAGALSVTAAARAVAPGPGGNVAAGSVRTMSVAPTGIAACTNAAAFSGGAEAEGDEALRGRILAAYRTAPNGTNAAWYRARALAIEGVAAVSVVPKARGLGTVDVVVAAPGGLPTDALLETVRAELAQEREIAVSVQTAAPTAVETDVGVTVKAADGYVPGQVLADVKAAIRGWFTGALLGRDLLLADLGRTIYAVPGVANYAIAAPKADVSSTARQLPTLGTLSVQEMT